ncbi:MULTISPECIES: hypothetical protein [unclassified Corallococcus]|uniref:hypothetical protein n=1 Tax=unclassified Corallococcus TaxID=2685029 RepID=UPI001A902141|nr:MULTISPECIES: hypothetical protein [unclassified Corallococcus]MBN9681411.1 hypothetical protein [Corallococcus sp. NCSPR001]WAS87010.1 hypothetical protein O0N60_08530 [Corallococcus sp. NCRR]
MPSIPWLRASGLAVAALCLSACDSGSDTTELRFGIHPTTYMRPLTAEASSRRTAMESPPPPPTFRSDDGLVFTVESANATLFDVRLYLPPGRECSDYEGQLDPLVTCTDAADGEYGMLSVREPLEVDWMNATLLPDWPLRIPQGFYGSVEARLGQNTPALPSFSLEASFTWKDQRHVLKVAFPSTAALRFEARDPLDILSGGENSLVVGSLDLTTWLDFIPVEACLASGDLTLDGTTLRLETGKGECANAAVLMRNNIETSAKVFRATHR